MEIKGRVKTLGTLTEGTSARGAWQKQELIIETIEQYPKQVCLICWGERVTEAQRFTEGQVITAHINIESREFNGKWYTDVKPWKFEAEEVDSLQAINQQATYQPEPMTYQDSRTPQQNVMDFLQQDDNVEYDGDLPF
jgi:hypothetical protein